MNNTFRDKIFKKLDTVVDKESKLYIGLSGGADSSVLTYFVKKYFEKKYFSFDNINLLVFNHNYRKETDNEIKKIKQTYRPFDITIGKYVGNNFDENTLRKARYSFFDKNIPKGDNVYLCLGHNLTDRIETTFLNMMRGCHKKGFLNMSFQDIAYWNENEINILRPLIDIPKSQIFDFADSHNIRYFEDESNKDTDLSKRNFIRHNILKEILNESNIDKNGNNKFLDSFVKIYNILETQDNSIQLEKINYPGYIDIEKSYKISASRIDSLNKLGALYKKLGIYQNVTEANLKEFLDFIQNSISGYKYFNGIYIFKAYGNLYLIKGVKDFWKKYLADEKKITKKGVQKFMDMDFNIKDSFLVGGKLCFPCRGDKYRGKYLTKYLNNQKIPIFLRKFVPIVKKDGEIKKLYTDKII